MPYFSESVFRCSGCSFRCSDPHQDISRPAWLFALHVYDFGHGKIAPVSPQEAFCARCQKVVLAESLPDENVVRGYIRGLDNPRYHQYQLSSRCKQVFKASAAVWEAWSAEAATRRARCLDCGDMALALSDAEEEGQDTQGDDPYRKYKHPGCKGTLTVAHGIARLEFDEPDEPPLMRYSPLGERLDEQPIPLLVFIEQHSSDGAPPAEVEVDVEVLDPKGNYRTRWMVGQQVPRDLFEKAYDRQAECLYAITTYEAGTAKTFVATRERWLQAKAMIRRLDPGDA